MSDKTTVTNSKIGHKSDQNDPLKYKIDANQDKICILLTYGYVREHSNIESIPIDILWMLTVFHNYTMHFHHNSKQHERYLQFSSDHCVTRIIQATKNANNFRYTTCLFGLTITSKICDKYNIYLNLNKGGFYMGYVTSIDAIKNWNTKIGGGENKNSSVGISVQSDRHYMYLFDKDHVYESLQYENGARFEIDDLIILSFDFKRDTLDIYHNHKKASSISLNGHKAIIPAFTLSTPYETIEILKYELL
eukprot:352487_1